MKFTSESRIAHSREKSFQAYRDRLEEQFSVSKGTLAGIEEKIGRRLRDLKEDKAVLKGHQYGRGIVG